MTAEEFETRYAWLSGMTVEELRRQGFRPVPCGPDCGYEDCKGWRMEVRHD